MSRNQSGFTLIELMVVVAIMTILMSILLPGLSGAREQARGIYCSNNVRQIMLANMQYGNENNETWPGRADDSVQNDYDNTLRSWVPCGTATDSRFDVKKGALYPLVKNEKLFLCPTDDQPNGQLSYSINANIYASTVCSPSREPTIRYPRPGRFSQRSDVLIVFVDEGGGPNGLNDGNFRPIYTPENNYMVDAPRWYHHDKATFGYFDGHVGLRRNDDPGIKDITNPAWFPDENNFEQVK